MKKIILLTLMLLSGLANASRVYDHVSAIRVLDDYFEDNIFFETNYFVTYTENTRRYVSVIEASSRRIFIYELPGVGSVNKVISYDMSHHQQMGTHVITFIAMNGGLYAMKNHRQPSKINGFDSSVDYDVVDVYQKYISGNDFIVVVNEKESTGDSTKLYDLHFSQDSYTMTKINTLSGVKTRSAKYYSKISQDIGKEEFLVLKTEDNKIIVLGSNGGSWTEKSQMTGSANDKFMLLGQGRVVKYDGALSMWKYNKDVSNRTGFSEVFNGASGPNYFDDVSYGNLYLSFVLVNMNRFGQLSFYLQQPNNAEKLPIDILENSNLISQNEFNDGYYSDPRVITVSSQMLYLTKLKNSEQYSIYGVVQKPKGTPHEYQYKLEKFCDLPEG